MKKVFQAFPAFVIKLTKSTAEDAALGHFCSNLFINLPKETTQLHCRAKFPILRGQSYRVFIVEVVIFSLFPCNFYIFTII